MKQIITYSLLLLMAFIGLSINTAYAEKRLYVRSVIDGDTILLNTGTKVRLLGIDTPEIDYRSGKAEPFAYQAKARLERLTDRKQIRLEYDQEKTDQYGRTLAHVYTKDGLWLNKTLIEEGFAHVYTFPKNTKHAQTLLQAEQQAIAHKKGIWGHNKWRQTPANDKHKLRELIGKYTFVTGKVTHVNQVGDKLYINFGNNWRQDFTVQIKDKDKKNFSAHTLQKIKDMTGKTLTVRGRLIPVNGPMIIATHEEQLTF